MSKVFHTVQMDSNEAFMSTKGCKHLSPTTWCSSAVGKVAWSDYAALCSF
jgi:hypothetical protein